MLGLRELDDVGRNVVGVGVVVAVLGRLEAVPEHGVEALEVGLERLVELRKGVLALVVDELLDGRHGVGVGGKAAPDHAGAEVVHGAA